MPPVSKRSSLNSSSKSSVWYCILAHTPARHSPNTPSSPIRKGSLPLRPGEWSVFENPLGFVFLFFFFSNKFMLSLRQKSHKSKLINFSEKDVANLKAITTTYASQLLCFIQHFIFTIGFNDCCVCYHNHLHSISS